ncbi:cell division protein FtsB [Streptacidiphilus sp. MAP12-20]|uniref:FtsB family cell division protein n=1 Tax=Streptacidiphilus sp. MAP12-20 TaxID=3156299 RepID=UPI003511DCFC
MAVGRGRGTRSAKAGRGPFALLVMVLLASGLIALLMLNTALSQGGFTVSKLQRQTTSLQNERQGLQQQIDGWSAPDALAARARGLGMVPSGNPAFLADNGKTLGDPSRLPAAPSPTPTSVTAPVTTPTPTPTPHATAHSTAPSGKPSKPSTPPSGH